MLFVKHSRICLVLGLFILAVSCRKVKVDDGNPLTGNQVTPAQSSSIRLFNFFNAPLEVTANNIPLTVISTSSNATQNQVGQSLFPTGVWTAGDDGSPVSMPVALLDKN